MLNGRPDVEFLSGIFDERDSGVDDSIYNCPSKENLNFFFFIFFFLSDER